MNCFILSHHKIHLHYKVILYTLLFLRNFLYLIIITLTRRQKVSTLLVLSHQTISPWPCLVQRRD